MQRIHTRRTAALMALCATLLLIVAAGSSRSVQSQDVQPTPTFPYDFAPVFTVEGEIGRALPRRLLYEPQTEQYAIVDAYNQLSLADATTYRAQHILHPISSVVDLRFSPDARWLAVINGVNVELWDARTGQQIAQITAPGSPKRLFGPLAFSENGETLVFYAEYAAPPERRVSENDTITYPWVWHLGAALGQSESTLPGGVESLPLYDYAFGFVMAANDRIVAALPARLRILDALTLGTVFEIPTDRFAETPLTVWNSLTGPQVYVQSGSENLLQLDTETGVLTEIPFVWRTNNTLPSLAQFSGQQAFTNILFDPDTISREGLFSGTISIIDFLQPPSTDPANVIVLLHIDSPDRDYDRYQLTSGQIGQFSLAPDGQTFLVRASNRNDGLEYVIQYELATGAELGRHLPSLRSIGGFSRAAQNRVLSYDASGSTLLSDFERLSASDLAVVNDDLRYSFQFERFFFGRDPGTMVTQSGSEWRVWDIPTNAVIRRDTLRISNIIGTSPDGYRYLGDTGSGYQVQDFDTGDLYTLQAVSTLDGLSLNSYYINPGWTRLLTVYENVTTGQYSPGNAVMIYNGDGSTQAFIAGDDLPPVGERRYGWVNDDTAFVYGRGALSDMPARIFGVEYAPSGLPACLESAYPGQRETLLILWDALHYYLFPDHLNETAQRACGLAESASYTAVETLLSATSTPGFAPTGVASGDAPACLLQRYPGEEAAYTQVWQTMTASLNPDQVRELEAVLCDYYDDANTLSGGGEVSTQTMFINADTGERASGDIPADDSAPGQPDPIVESIAAAFEAAYQRPLGNAILSPDRDLLAVSNLPGELTVYRLGFTYAQAVAPVTQTAQAVSTAQNLIFAQPSPSPTYGLIGTARPTLTSTPPQTLVPRPQQGIQVTPPDQTTLCPANTLFSVSSPPPDYAPTGRIYVTLGDVPIWSVEPENGSRAEAPEAPACNGGLNCQFSPDRSWILAQTYELVYITRPDGSDQRVLWDLRTPNPSTPFPDNLRWSGRDMLEWDAYMIVPGTDLYDYGVIRDVLNVYPDPDPWFPVTLPMINHLPTTLVSRQPGGFWTIVSTPYAHAGGYGAKFYLYHVLTGEYAVFAQHPDGYLDHGWGPYGDRLYFSFYENDRQDRYEIVFPESHLEPLLASRERAEPSGQFSPDGRSIALWINGRFNVVDTQTGSITTYCVPGSHEGLLWSPDSRYIAFELRFSANDEERLIVLDTVTGYLVEVTQGIYSLVTWAQEPGTYYTGPVVTPTAFPTSAAVPSSTPSGG